MSLFVRQTHMEVGGQCVAGRPDLGWRAHFDYIPAQSALAKNRTEKAAVLRSVKVDASLIWRGLQAHAPELNKGWQPHLKPTNNSYRIDETYINVKGEEKYLYRALDSTG